LNSSDGKINPETAVICVVGLGYVGLPLAAAFAQSLKVIGFDNNVDKINILNRQENGSLTCTADPGQIGKADFIIICVPTPINTSKEPDLSYIESAARVVGQNMKPGRTVVLESTVYPGVTEEIVVPILEKESGLKCGKDFKVGYSPERINPGDTEHTVSRTVKVVAGMDEETTEVLAALYGRVTAGIYKAKNIRTAEAAKLTENIQRDLNIALMNELSMIFEKIGIDTREVLDAAATKWNFHRYSPGLVGGYCIPVVPYYLIHKARKLGYQPRLIPAGRDVNNSMPAYVAGMTATALKNAGKTPPQARALIMGLTYKENVADTRESPVIGLIEELKKSGMEIYGYDPMLEDIEKDFPVKAVSKLEDIRKLDAIIAAVAHDSFREISPARLRKIAGDQPILIDIRRVFNRGEAEREGFHYYTI
jgi:UDPglucose 6-dehydrogenase/UDP-N-acetyl-D-galactosamine dehydrogenase